jgi:lipopolysaccharide transport system ATP-binding protein
MHKSIVVKNLSKIYRLGEYSTGTLSQDLELSMRNFFGFTNKFSKLNLNNDKYLNNSDFVYSLKEINFELNEGDALGVVGKNGAGKSTLLKLLSRITTPSSGEIRLKGRVASLLEVGTGFHPELTGRENIFLNGAILGMKRFEIKNKLDEIIDFSGVEKYIDTPVKRYSSGMYVRLAFAVAAFLESEILFLDEVLAVGDLEFQNKSLTKINNLITSTGKTIIFVSHNMSLISSLCNKSLLLEKGNMVAFDKTTNILDLYSNLNRKKFELELNYFDKNLFQNKYLKIESLNFNHSNSKLITMSSKRELDIDISGNLFQDLKMSLEFRIYDDFNRKIFMYCPSQITGKIYDLKKGNFTLHEKILFPETLTTCELTIEIELTYPEVQTYWTSSDLYRIKFDGYVCNTGQVYNINDALILLGK